MTAPSRDHGQSATVLQAIALWEQEKAIRSCESKVRYADEHVCRAVGMREMEYHAKYQLYLYQCAICRGWHLTRVRSAPMYAVDYYSKTYK